MNKANVFGKAIEDGDYAIIDSKVKSPENNTYVVSVIGGVCNIKRFVRDTVHNQVILVSESTSDFPPIYIHPEETNYFVSGKVVDVIKGPPVRR